MFLFTPTLLRLFQFEIFSDGLSFPQTVCARTTRRTHLPVEILQEIFYYSCLVNLYQGADESGSIPACPSSTGQLTRTSLSLVSKHWRSIITDTPVLWSQIIITSTTPSEFHLRRLLHLSESSTLEVYINFSILKGDDQIPSLFTILRSHLPRLETFILVDFCYWRYTLDSFLRPLFPTNTHSRLERLRTFHITGDDYFLRPCQQVCGTINAPNLIDVVLPACYESILDRNTRLNLQKVDICMKEEEGWRPMELLAQGPALEHLEIRFRFDKAPRVQSNVYFSKTLSILSLDIHGDDSSGIHALTKYLYFPGLRDLTFKYTSYGDPYSEEFGMQSLQELVFNKSPNISSLRLHFLYLNTDMLELFAYLKQLRVLQLYSCRFQPHFLLLFRNTNICPRLEEFTVTSRYSDTFSQDVQSLLIERPQFTTSLKIFTRLFTRDDEKAKMEVLKLTCFNCIV